MNENHVAIKIFDYDGPPQELSSALGLEPTKTASKGDKYGKLNKVYPWNYWEYRWIRTEDRFIGDLVEEFLAQVIEPRKEVLRKVIATCSAELSVVQHYEGGNPGFHLGRNAIVILSYIGAELDIDVYCGPEDA